MGKTLRRKGLYVILITTIAIAAVLIPTLIWLGRPCVIDRPTMVDWDETFAWMDENLTAGTPIVAWGINADYITLYSNCTSLFDCKNYNETLAGLVGRFFMATNESEAIDLLNFLGTSYVLVSWSFFVPDSFGDEHNWHAMIQTAAEQLKGTQWEIGIGDRLNEESSKPTEEFFDTMLWRMLTYDEPFIDYYADEGNKGIIEYLIQYEYPLGYFLARLNWADPWVPDSQPIHGHWEDDAGHRWSYHNPPLGDGMIDDGYVNYDQDPEDDTLGTFANLQKFNLTFITSYHKIKIFKVQ